MCSLPNLLILRLVSCQLHNEYVTNITLDLDPSGCTRRVWRITLLRSELECHGFYLHSICNNWSHTTPISKNFHVLPYIHFLSLLEFKHWLDNMVLLPSSIPMPTFQRSKQGFSSDPSHVARRVWGPDYANVASETVMIAG